MRIRTTSPADADVLTAIEAACFPAAEAASRTAHGGAVWHQMRLTFPPLQIHRI